MLTKAYATTILANAISSCYLEGGNRKPLPPGTKQTKVLATIKNITFSSNYTKEVFSLLVDACDYDLDFDAFILSVYNCEGIDKASTTHTSAEEYLIERHII